MPSYRSRSFLVPDIEGQMGVKMGQKLDFRSFLKNYSTDLVPSPSEGRYHYSTYSCQFLSPGHFLFSRYSSQRQFSTSRNVEISLKFCCVSVCIFVVYLFVCVVCRSFSQFLTMSQSVSQSYTTFLKKNIPPIFSSRKIVKVRQVAQV